MTDKTTQVSIKQRVPLDIFCCTLADYLNKGEINEQYLLENLHSVFSGEYNIKLAFNYIKSSILNPLINETLVQNKKICRNMSKKIVKIKKNNELFMYYL